MNHDKFNLSLTEHLQGIKTTLWMTELKEYPGGKKYVRTWLVSERVQQPFRKQEQRKDAPIVQVDEEEVL